MKYHLLLASVFGVLTVLSVAPSAQCSEKVLLNFNEIGSTGTTWLGWTWYPTGANDFGAVGWRKDDGKFYSGDSNWMPRIHEKTDYGNDALAIIDSTVRAPSTKDGSSLKIYDSGVSSKYQACYWYLFGDSFSTKGLADSTTNRFDFYFKPDFSANSGLTSDPDNGNIHVGTYLCWPGGGLGGEDCPEEASNQHYYHYLTVNPGAWLHVQLDRRPTHQRGLSGAAEPVDDPAFPTYGKHYYENMNSMYIEIRYAQTQLTKYWIDEMKLWTQSEPQNEISISSVWVGYWPETGKWEIGWNDNSFNATGYNSTSQSTFEVRWSTSPITNANYASASPIEPEYWERGTTNTFRRPNSWKKPAWTRFTLPTSIMQTSTKIYFAIKDVSSIANGDGHNAQSPNIKTIDYAIKSQPNPVALYIKSISK